MHKAESVDKLIGCANRRRAKERVSRTVCATQSTTKQVKIINKNKALERKKNDNATRDRNKKQDERDS
jgi:hypothetical protein